MEASARSQPARLQFPPTASGWSVIADFATLDAKLVIELDGASHHSPEAAAYDERRTAFLKSRDYLVLRFQNEDVFRDVYWVMEIIMRHVPPPSRGR